MNPRLRPTPTRVFLLGVVLAIVGLLLPWFRYSVSDSVDPKLLASINTGAIKGLDVSVFWSKFPVVLLIVIATLAIIRRSPTIELPAVDLDRTYVVLAALAVVILGLKLAIGQSVDKGLLKADAVVGISLGRSWGLFVTFGGALMALAATIWHDRVVRVNHDS
jgi:hypothetical protein